MFRWFEAATEEMPSSFSSVLHFPTVNRFYAEYNGRPSVDFTVQSEYKGPVYK